MLRTLRVTVPQQEKEERWSGGNWGEGGEKLQSHKVLRITRLNYSQPCTRASCTQDSEARAGSFPARTSALLAFQSSTPTLISKHRVSQLLRLSVCFMHHVLTSLTGTNRFTPTSSHTSFQPLLKWSQRTQVPHTKTRFVPRGCPHTWQQLARFNLLQVLFCQ